MSDDLKDNQRSAGHPPARDGGSLPAPRGPSEETRVLEQLERWLQGIEASSGVCAVELLSGNGDVLATMVAVEGHLRFGLGAADSLDVGFAQSMPAFRRVLAKVALWERVIDGAKPNEAMYDPIEAGIGGVLVDLTGRALVFIARIAGHRSAVPGGVRVSELVLSGPSRRPVLPPMQLLLSFAKRSAIAVPGDFWECAEKLDVDEGWFFERSLSGELFPVAVSTRREASVGDETNVRGTARLFSKFLSDIQKAWGGARPQPSRRYGVLVSDGEAFCVVERDSSVVVLRVHLTRLGTVLGCVERTAQAEGE